MITHCLKITQNVTFDFLPFAFSSNICPIKSDLSGNTVWPQASIRSQCCEMRLFLQFSNTVWLEYISYALKSSRPMTKLCILAIPWSFFICLNIFIMVANLGSVWRNPTLSKAWNGSFWKNGSMKKGLCHTWKNWATLINSSLLSVASSFNKSKITSESSLALGLTTSSVKLNHSSITGL